MQTKKIKTKTGQFTFFEAVALLVGTVFGAGYLGIPYVVSKIGLISGILLIVAIGLLVLLQFLMVAEIALRTKSRHQIAGYVSKYLGRRWRPFVYAVVIFEFFGGLLAYVVGEGEVLAAMFSGNPVIYSMGFAAVMSVFIFHGLKMIEKLDLVLALLVAFVIICIALLSGQSISFENFQIISDFNALLPAYGVILFSFLGAAAVPEMRVALKGREKRLPKAIIIATIIPTVIYILFTIAVIGVTGENTSQVAMIALGQKLGPEVVILGNFLAVLTMATGFLGISLALQETFRFDLYFRKVSAWCLTVFVPPLILLLGVNDFIKILLIVGALFGGLQGIIIVFTAFHAVKKGDRKPEFVLHHKKIAGTILVVVFLLGIIYAVLDVLGKV